MRNRFCAPLAATMAMMALGQPLAGQPGADWRQAIQNKLLSQFKLTKATADKSSIVTAGSVVVLKKDHLVLYSTARRFLQGDNYVNGTINAGLFSSALVRAEDGSARSFVAGEKLWLTQILFEPNNDGVVLEFLSAAFDDARFWGTLKFPFAKNSPPPGAEEFANTVAQVIGVDDAAAAAPVQAVPARGPATAATPAAEAPPAEAPRSARTPIPAPPRPPDHPPVPTPTLALGQTKDQVIAIMGRPLKIANLGAKQIYLYKDFKVTLTAGKITDVE